MGKSDPCQTRRARAVSGPCQTRVRAVSGTGGKGSEQEKEGRCLFLEVL